MDAVFLQGTGELMIKKLSTYNVEYFFAEKEKNQSLKQLYCMALSVQGQSKTLDGYIGTKKTGKTLTIQKNPIHKEIYNDIRNRTFKIMDKISFALKEDFLEYNVDCITFKMAKNCKLVEKILTDENLQFKKI